MIGDQIITVSYGKVVGKARRFPYFQPAIYEVQQLKNGKTVYKYVNHIGTARRSYNKAENDAQNYGLKYVEGIRNLMEVKC